MNSWVDRSTETRPHHYLCFEYDDFPYTLIVSGETANLIAGHSLTEPGVIVAKNLFCIFGKEAPTNIEERKSYARSLAIYFLDIAFCKIREVWLK